MAVVAVMRMSPNAVVVIRYRYEDLRSSDELCNDERGEEYDERTGKDEREDARTETCIDDVDNRDGVDATRDERELLAHHTEEQYKRNDLRHRPNTPIQSRIPRLDQACLRKR